EDGLVYVPLAQVEAANPMVGRDAAVGVIGRLRRPDHFISVGNAGGELAQFGTAPDPPDAGKHDRKAGLAWALRAQMALERGYVPPEECEGAPVVAYHIIALAQPVLHLVSEGYIPEAIGKGQGALAELHGSIILTHDPAIVGQIG